MRTILNRILKFVFPIVMAVFAVILIVAGVKKLQSRRLYDASTKAVIVGIEREWTGTDEDGFDTYDYKVYVDYEVDGKKYENREYPGYNSSMKKGDEVEILYQSSNPENFAEKNVTGNSVIMIVIGAVLALAGVFMGLRAFIRR